MNIQFILNSGVKRVSLYGMDYWLIGDWWIPIESTINDCDYIRVIDDSDN